MTVTCTQTSFLGSCVVQEAELGRLIKAVLVSLPLPLLNLEKSYK